MVLKIAALLKGFCLDRLDGGMLAFMAEETISLRWTPKIKAMSRFSLGGTTSPKRCRAEKTKVLIQMCFSGQTVEVGPDKEKEAPRCLK